VPGDAFAKVRELRPFVGALFERTVELRQCEHRAIELLREALEAARDLADLLLARGLRRLRRAAHELEVVDEDQAALLRAAVARKHRGIGAPPARAGSHLA